VSGATALSSSIVGSFSANWCSVKPPTTRTHCGVGVLYSVGTAGLLERMTKKPEQDYIQALHSAVEPLTRALKERPPEVQAASGGRSAP
jgi:hypothetical protein